MDAAKRKQVVGDLVNLAREYNRKGDTTLRNQTLRNLENACLTLAHYRAAEREVYRTEGKQQ